MNSPQALRRLERLFQWLLGALILKVTLSIVWQYGDYLPPTFETGFLHGRQSYFWGGYHWAFYSHILAGPLALVGGLVLLSERFRRWRPAWHRRLGRVQVAVVLAVASSGATMAFHAATGLVAGAGFAALGVATAVTGVAGWRAAVGRRFAVHRRWMMRCYVLLCAAVMLRIMGGAATVLGLQSNWPYMASAWASWLGPLVMLEWLHRRRNELTRPLR